MLSSRERHSRPSDLADVTQRVSGTFLCVGLEAPHADQCHRDPSRRPERSCYGNVEISHTEIPTCPQPQLKLEINIQARRARRVLGSFGTSWAAGTPAESRRRDGVRIGKGKHLLRVLVFSFAYPHPIPPRSARCPLKVACWSSSLRPLRSLRFVLNRVNSGCPLVPV